MEISIKKNDKFRITKFIIDEIKIISTGKFEDTSKIYTSVVIGENGVGKSILLSKVENIFNHIYKIINMERLPYMRNTISYELEYKLDGNIYKALYSNNEIEFYIDDIKIKDKSLFKIPNKVLCCSFQMNDKFTFRKENNKEIIKYLGIKTTPTMTNTSSISKKICNNILDCINNFEKTESLIKCFDFLNLEKEILITYKLKQIQRFFEHEITIDTIVDKIENGMWKNRKSAAFGKGILEEIRNDKEMLSRLVRQIYIFMKERRKGNEMRLRFKLGERYSYFKEYIDLEALEILIKLDIISNPNIKVQKQGYYDLERGSSGELHILFLLTNILSNLEENSLILIDEPEISLHPSWQIKIIGLIRNILEEVNKSCHIMIATHSHFTVSDLQPSNSSLHILKTDKYTGNLICEEVTSNTYGWSAENILLNVFGVPSNRNYYLIQKIDKLLSDVSNGNIKSVINEKNELQSIASNLLDSDPLKVIIYKMIKRAEKDYKQDNEYTNPI
ncbi:hypothetical protein FDC45_11065 [Clostridium botulinum]|uniref:ATPase AAA-type core domain-containing protein n=1 Tax=Clostridium botulinum TaxID=1491 RepID=A0A846J694_CLOBO|nr:AAA family ATPase [Clostridium botulinum]ACA57416.1 conserved hypothetical protein [Clostridium botulinum A3 str. Loch Maree]NFH65038.1 hypothetical protein [Clostridium botulinum]NFJ09508.1 hypothetical protein [Clostridium botulinum]NFK16670.1 hypothetical protein [Clostridium botulinum]NFM93442.1 hypothetical protein [Clostridium botulinum]